MVAVEAVVLDMDGLLIDTEPVWRVASAAVFAGLGILLSEQELLDSTGQPIEELIPLWRGRSPDGGTPGDGEGARLTDDEVADLIVDQVIAHVKAEGEPMPGVMAAVARFRRYGLRLAIASSSPRRLIDTVLAAARLAHWFQASVSTEEVAAGKPSPAVYHTVVQRLGVDASRAIAIEDSSNGLRSASAAGLGVLAVPHPAFPPAIDALALADVVVDSLDDITPELVASIGHQVGDRA